MSIYYADTSALAKRYIPEIGGNWVHSWIQPSAGNTIIVSALASVEFISLLERRRREGNVPLSSFIMLKNDFYFHLKRREYKVMRITHAHLNVARNLIERHGLRALDSIQLACAIASRSELSNEVIFVTADQRLLDAATAEGFTTDDPNQHT